MRAALERQAELGFDALFADSGDARSRFEAVVDLDPKGALRILAQTPHAFGPLVASLPGALPGVSPLALAEPLAAVLADLRVEPGRDPAGGPAEPSAPDVRLEFDGRMLTLRSATPERIVRESFPAVSGRPDADGGFDLSAERQAERGVGPLPEGVYHIHVDEVQSISTGDRVLGVFGRGAWPGGTYSWGEQRVWIHPGATHSGARGVEVPVPGEDRTVTRDGFSIHGGRSPGSAGCIDLTIHDDSFFRSLAETRSHTSVIPLIVNYPETPGGPAVR